MNRRRYLSLVVTAGVLWGMVGTAARAGTLDRALLDHSYDILKALKEKGIDTVGVLPFQVQRGDRPAAVDAGPLGTNLPGRLENALIMTMDPASEELVVGVIRDAAATARKAGAGAYRTDEKAFAALFAPEYPLAWGDKKAKAKAFLTGTVVNRGGDRSKTRVKVELLTPTSWKDGKPEPDQSWTFEAKADALLMADLGYTFALSPLVMTRGLHLSERNAAVSQQVTRTDETGTARAGDYDSPAVTPDNFAGFAYELQYNGVGQTLKAAGGKAGARQAEFVAPPAEPGATITMKVTRIDKTAGKLGLLLLVNGKSTFAFEEADPFACRKWVYGADAAGRADIWKGFYLDQTGNNVLRFKTLTPADAAARAGDMGGRAGLIDLYVFGSQAKADEPKPAEDAGELISTKGMPAAKEGSLALARLREQLLAANNVRGKKAFVARKAGGLILHEMEPQEGVTYSTADLPNPVLLGHLTIRYYDRGE